MSKKSMTQGLTTLLFAVFLYSQPLVGKALAENAPTIESVYPGLATGFLKSATLAKMDKGTLLQGKGVEIQASFAEKILGQATPEIRKELEQNMFFLLEQEAIQEFIRQDAEAMGISVKQPEKEMFHSLREPADKRSERHRSRGARLLRQQQRDGGRQLF